jgi:uncharacterized RDD family membrane protein YckC
MEYAGFWRRFCGAFIDGIICWVLGMVAGLVTGAPLAIGIVMAILYQPFFESSELQATPGKALLGMRVTDMNGGRITFKKAFIRWLVRIVSGLILCIGYLMMLFTEKKQTLHDLAAETLVVNGEIKNINYFQAWYHQVLEVLGMVDKVPTKRETPVSKHESSPADLAGLYELFQKGILTEAEYQQKRQELLNKL